VALEPPFEYRDTRLVIDVPFEIDAKSADTNEHLVAIRFLLGDEEDREAE